MEESRVLVERRGMLIVTLDRVENGRIMVVYRSLLIKEDDDWLSEAQELIDTHCTMEIDSETVEDAGMFKRRATRVVTRVWDKCPGGVHDCASLPIPAAREGEECPTIDRSVSSKSTRTVRTATS